MGTDENKIPPLVSIICITYNHEKLISQAIHGFLIQKTSFPFEIIIGEDHSTDGTFEIVENFVKKYPGIIILTTSDHNVGIIANERRTILRATGKYIAFCEGDDYWTDPLKLQKQIDFLEKNDDYSVCFHRWKNYDIETETWSDDSCKDLFTVKGRIGIEITTEMFLHNWITQPFTMVCKRDLLDLEIVKKYNYYRDNHMIYHLLQKGKGYLFAFEGGVYNHHIDGIHSKMNAINDNELTVKIARELYLMNKSDNLLKLNLLRSLQYNIVYASKSKSEVIPVLFYVLENFRYSLSLKQLVKNILLVIKSIKIKNSGKK